jgi:hypothetical protein
VEAVSLVSVEVVGLCQLANREKLDDFALGEVGGLVEQQSTVVDPSAQRIHSTSLPPPPGISQS